MQGANAVYLAVAEHFRHQKPRSTIILEFVSGEEGKEKEGIPGGLGTLAMMAINRELADQHPYRACILGEPTNGDSFGVARNGAMKYLAQARARSGHGSDFEGEEKTALDLLFEFGQALKVTLRNWQVRYGQDPDFAPPSATVTNFDFGNGDLNVVDGLATAIVDVRLPQAMINDLAIVEQEMITPGVTVEPLTTDPPTAPVCPKDALIRQLATEAFPNYPQRPLRYATDSQGLQDAGWPTLHFGPGKEEQMHAAHESIPRDDLKEYFNTAIRFPGLFADFVARHRAQEKTVKL
jgi:acetylornithine deacetylase/succinyl-diaminopimelate desuccinylase-like protein